MRLIVARCSAIYSGRLDTVLPEALRLIMVKADGSVLLHADSGGYKPLNCRLRTVHEDVTGPAPLADAAEFPSVDQIIEQP